MNDDETRILDPCVNWPKPSLVSSGPLGRVAQAPSVGVPSMGHTHHGDGPETRIPPSVVVTNTPSVRVPTLRPLERSETSVDRCLVGWKPRLTKLPWAPLLGLFLGLGAALLVLLPESTKRSSIDQPLGDSPSFRVVVHTSSSDPIENVPVQFGREIVFTDEAGTAEAVSGARGDPLSLHATCPKGYSGESLQREFSSAVLRSAPHWHLELLCEPEFFRVTIDVRVTGCGKARVLIDGVDVGITENERVQWERRFSTERLIAVTAQPLQGKCDIPTRTETVERGVSRLEFHLEGHRPKKTTRTTVPVRKKQAVPYRL